MEHPKEIISISSGSVIRTILIGICFFAAFILKDLILVVLMSVLIASSVEPLTMALTRKKIPRLVAVIGIYLGIILGMIAFIYFLLIPLLSESTEFIKNFPQYFNAKSLSNSISHNDFLASQPFVEGLRNSIDVEQVVGQINKLVSNLSSGAFNTITTVFGGILSFLLMFVLSFYLAVEDDGVGKFLKIVTPLKHEKYVINLWKRSQKKIGLWMQGQIILGAIIGVLAYLGLTLLGVPNALLLAVFAGLFEIIPLFGPIISSIPAIAVAFVDGGVTSALLVVGLYIIINQFENQLIYPLVVKKVIGVSPIVSMIALVAGFELLGFLGIILSVPVAAVLIEFFDDLERDKIEKIEQMMNSSS